MISELQIFSKNIIIKSILISTLLLTGPILQSTADAQERFDVQKIITTTDSTTTVQNSDIRILSPRGAMLRSIAIPGWGQLYNGKRFKALVFFCGEFSLLANSIYLNQKYQESVNAFNDINGRIVELQAVEASTGEPQSEIYQLEKDKSYQNQNKEFYIENRNLSTWWLVGSVLYSMMDAYVDAHLSTFDESPDLSFLCNPTKFPRSMNVLLTFRLN